MVNDPVPDSDHVSRLCKPSHIVDGVPAATAFKLRAGEKYLSVNWLEYLALSDRPSAIAEIRRVLNAKLTISARAKIAILNVGTLRDAVRNSTGTSLRVLHVPEPDDPSHSGIHDIPLDDHLIAEELALAVQDAQPAKE